MVKKLQNVQTGPKNSANPYRFIVYRHVLWMQSNNDCSKKKNKQDGVHLQVTLKLLSKTSDTILFDKNQPNMAI